MRSEEKKKLERYLAKLTADSELVGLTGLGYPHSFYRVYTRPIAGKGSWWKFESGGGPSRYTSPLKYQTDLGPSKAATTIWGRVLLAAVYDVMPGREGLVMLAARAKELLEPFSKDEKVRIR